MENKIIQIIESLIGFNGLKENKNIDLLENEILDSVAFIELITCLEDEFNIEIQPTQVNPNVWRNIEQIVDLVEQLQSSNNISKYLDLQDKTNYIKLNQPAQSIKNGKLVVFPTETVYGIGANALDENAVKLLYEVKQRPLTKPISLLVNNIDMIKNVATDISNLEYALIKEFMPGPLTIILKKKDIIPNIVTANLDSVGIRIPANEIALKLIELAGVPIATPSANISGHPSGTNLKYIMNDFKHNVDYFIDGGISGIGLASTIVQIIDNVPHILRQGSISKEQIESFCSNFIG